MSGETLTVRVAKLETIGREMNDWLHNGLTEKIGQVVSEVLVAKQKEGWEQEREERRLQIEEQRMRNEATGKAKDRTNRILIATIVPATVGALKLAEAIFGG